jgi:hypothetical protein
MVGAAGHSGEEGEQTSDRSGWSTLGRKCCTMPLYIRRWFVIQTRNERVRWYTLHDADRSRTYDLPRDPSE